MIISTKFSLQSTLFLFLIVMSNLLVITLSIENNGVKCIDSERQALLMFKSNLVDESNQLSTWRTHDKECCKWKGITCENRTNQIVSLNLPGPENLLFNTPLSGNISSSLLQLVGLTYLDLSNNDFNTIPIPEFIGSFAKLQHLNLSHCNFIGSIPVHLGKLSMIQVLDLSGINGISGTDLDWLSGFRSLQHLDLSGIYFHNAATWLDSIKSLTQLKKIYLRSCGIQETLPNPSFSLTNASNSLVVLDLSTNNLTRSTFLWFLNLSTSYSYIDFSFNPLGGNIPDALTNLTSLSYLDLSGNNLEGRIPNSIGNLISLGYLALSGNKLEGNIPYSLGNLMSISYLDLSSNNLQGGFPRSPGNLSNLVTLKFSDNKLDGDLTYMSEFLSESTLLEFLDMSNNIFYGSIPPLSRFSILKTVDLSRNRLNESFTENRLQLPYLRILNVAENRLTGRLPDFASCSSLSFLGLNDNRFNGTLTESIGYLSNLDNLDLHSNDFEGFVSENHFFNLSILGVLDLSFNPKLSVQISTSWNPPFQLGTLKLANCNLGPSFPKWLQKQKRIAHLDISSSQIYDSVPEWLWNTSFILDHLNMSYNHMHGALPSFLSKSTFSLLDLRSNEFNGSLPFLPSASTYLDLSRNRFSGDINDFCNGTYGRTVLDLSENILSGELSMDCFKNMMTQDYLNLGSNNFSGEIPNVNDWYCVFVSLHLRNNSFRGELPASLRECSRLKILDLGENHFTGEIPTWIGENLSEVGVISLRSNELSGTLPSNLCLLANIQILDVSMNNVSGTIPRCLSNFTSMSTKPNSSEYNTFLYLQRATPSFYDNAYIMWKGQGTEYVNTLGLVKVIDLSSNNLVGEIPSEITVLEGLVALNLSRNNLVGSIPHDISKLEYLNFLDLSQNNLSGRIPMSLSDLSHLGVLNLSFNDLSGRIPWSTHLQTFGNSSYVGNSELCGPPLLKLCPGDQMPQIPTFTSRSDSEDYLAQEDVYITKGFYVSMAIGFILAFWGMFGTLTFNKSCGTKVWRIGGM